MEHRGTGVRSEESTVSVSNIPQEVKLWAIEYQSQVPPMGSALVYLEAEGANSLRAQYRSGILALSSKINSMDWGNC